MVHVNNFAKDTGDYFNLSKVDKMVIGMGVELSKIRGQYDKVRTEPKPLQEFKPTYLGTSYEAQNKEVESSDEEEQAKPVVKDDDDWEEVEEDR